MTGAVASLILLAAACSQKAAVIVTPSEFDASETMAEVIVTLPALDASEIKTAEALVVSFDYFPGLVAPDVEIIDADENAAAYMGVGMGWTTIYTGGFGILLAPILLPAFAIAGAAEAHSAEEVDAAAAAFNSVLQDKGLLTSLDRSFLEAVGEDDAKHWNCVKVESLVAEKPCSASSPIARIALYPDFEIAPTAREEIDPFIRFSGTVSAIVTVDHALSVASADKIVEAKWLYNERLGSFFELAEDDGALLRRKVEGILNRFARRIADDLYQKPRPQKFLMSGVMDTAGEYASYDITLLEGDIIRLDQNYNVLSNRWGYGTWLVATRPQ
jgi:hypothetical protein